MPQASRVDVLIARRRAAPRGLKLGLKDFKSHEMADRRNFHYTRKNRFGLKRTGAQTESANRPFCSHKTDRAATSRHTAEARRPAPPPAPPATMLSKLNPNAVRLATTTLRGTQAPSGRAQPESISRVSACVCAWRHGGQRRSKSSLPSRAPRRSWCAV